MNAKDEENSTKTYLENQFENPLDAKFFAICDVYKIIKKIRI